MGAKALDGQAATARSCRGAGRCRWRKSLFPTPATIAKLLERDGVSAAVRASGDEKSFAEFRRCFPQELAAGQIWNDAEAWHWAEFSVNLDKARAAALAGSAEHTREAASWMLASKQRCEHSRIGSRTKARQGTTGARPDPLALAKSYVPAAERKLRDEIAALSSILRQAKAAEEVPKRRLRNSPIV